MKQKINEQMKNFFIKVIFFNPKGQKHGKLLVKVKL